MGSLIAWIYNKWAKVPVALQAGVTALVVAVIAIGMAFGWHWPSDWADVQAQVAAFWLVAAPIAWGIFQKQIWPPLFAWIISMLGMYYVGGIQGAKTRSVLKAA